MIIIHSNISKAVCPSAILKDCCLATITRNDNVGRICRAKAFSLQDWKWIAIAE